MTSHSDNSSRIVSGMRATGGLHLGHYHGVLKNWIELQKQHTCFFFVADWHALTTQYESPKDIRSNGWNMLIDWLAAGVDPERAHLFFQSSVQEHATLHLLLSMITPLGWLERVPTYKEQQEKLVAQDLNTYGFLGYPVLQAADVLLYRAEKVPVGEDQVSHIELMREIARRFNYLYGRETDAPEAPRKSILVEPHPLLTKTPKLLGLDGAKMSKSYGNTIGLREAPESVDKKIKAMPTDPARVRRNDPGDPTKCPVFSLHQVYTPAAERALLAEGCRSASIGCIDCKKILIQHVQTEQAPIIERGKIYEANPKKLKKIVEEGAAIARSIAQETLDSIQKVMGLSDG